MVPNCFLISYTSGATTLSPLSPYVSLIAPNMRYLSWLKQIIFGYDCVFPNVDKKLVRNDGDIDQVEIWELIWGAFSDCYSNFET